MNNKSPELERATNLPGHHDSLRLSSSQEAILLDLTVHPGSEPRYNIATYFDIRGEVCREHLQKAISQAVQSSSSMRLRFMKVADRFEHKFSHPNNVQLEFVDFSQEESPESVALRWVSKERLRPIPLTRLFRNVLLKLSNKHFYWYAQYSHLIVDGIGLGIFSSDVAALYSALIAQRELLVSDDSNQYVEYLQADVRYRYSKQYLEAQEYWMAHELGEPVSFKFGSNRDVGFQEPIKLRNRFDEKVAHGLHSVAESMGVRFPQLLLAAVILYIQRVVGIQEITIGLPNHRRSKDTLELVGTFSSTLPITTNVDSSLDLRAFVQSCKQQVGEVLKHRQFPIEKIRHTLGHQRTKQKPLYRIVVNLLESPGDLHFAGIPGKKGILSTVDTEDVVIWLYFKGDQFLLVQIDANGNLYHEWEVREHIKNLKYLLESLVEIPCSSSAEIPIFPQSDQHKLLNEWSCSESPYPEDKCLHELFEIQVTKTPSKLALSFEGAELSYKELNERSNQLAHYLVNQGVKPDTLVGMCFERSLEMVIGSLGILKAGGAYVPIDPAFPEQRKAWLLDDSAVEIVLTQQHLIADLSFCKKKKNILPLDGATAETLLGPHSNENLRVSNLRLSSDNLAYVIYTSGSTGHPKGVEVSHSAVMDYCCAGLSRYYDEVLLGSLLVTNFSADAAAPSIYLPLFVGGCVNLAPIELDLAKFWEKLIESEQAWLVRISPSHVQALSVVTIPKRSKISHRFLIGGEVLSKSHVDLLRSFFSSARIVNHYGPTEATVACCSFDVHRDSSIETNVPIGRPLGNSRLYVLDRNRMLLPIGAVGELYVGGNGLARGYLNQPELTKEKFFDHSFGKGAIERLYKTGDLVRWLPDKNLEFIGRIDEQVNIRGYRIELGEIESQLLRHSLVNSCVVTVLEDSAEQKRLVAYVVLKSGSGESFRSTEPGYQQELRTALQKILPEYMIPSAYVELEALPVTPNGKVDRKSLPSPDRNAYDLEQYMAPKTETEKLLVQIWAGLLGFEEDVISINANFFALGGHSLLVMQLLARLRKLGLPTDVRNVFDSPTIAGLAAVIDKFSSIDTYKVPPNIISLDCERITPDMLPLVDLGLEDIEKIVALVPGGVSNVQDIYPLAPLQEGILFHHLLGSDNDPYITRILYSIDSREQLDAYLEALQLVIDRHDVLRTAILTTEVSQPVQVVYRQVDLVVEQLKLNVDRDVREQLQTLVTGSQSMDISVAPLLRLSVAQDSRSMRWFVLWNMHHIISDHVALEIIRTEIAACLRGDEKQLPPASPYRNFVGHALHQARTLDAETFFGERLGDVVESTLPYGLVNVHGDGSEILEARRILLPELCQSIRAKAKEMQLSPAVLFHAAWSLVVGFCSGREDVVFGTVLSGRLQGTEEVERTLGLFINTLPVRILLTGVSAGQLVLDTEAALRALLSYEQVSLSVAQRCSGVDYEAPLFSAILNYRHSVPKNTEQDESGVLLLGAQERTNYPFTVSVDDLGDEFSVVAKIHRSVLANRVIDQLVAAISGLVAELDGGAETQVSELDLLSEEERYQQLVEWNATQTDYPKDKCVHELLEAQVAQNPNNLAVVFENQELTYSELNDRSNQVAHYLIGEGVVPDTLVGLCAERSLEMVVGLLGILKAGGAYVPIDPTYPEQRKAWLLVDSGVEIVLTQQHLLADLSFCRKNILPLDGAAGESSFGSHSKENLRANNLGLSSANLAYVIYTSGSTGQPKGVEVSHSAVMDYCHAGLSSYYDEGLSGSLLVTSFSFDATVPSIYVPLFTGGCVNLAPIEVGLAKFWSNLIGSEQAWLVRITPSHVQALAAVTPKGQSILSHCFVIGGEVLTRSHIELLRNYFPRARIVNHYGPTEAIVGCCSFDVHDDYSIESSVPIGRPLGNSKLYVVNQNQMLISTGAVGELCVGGTGLARGYLNNLELTEEKFIPNPFSAGPEERMYRTGDLVRWLSDGNLEFVGRVDDQVKIRGFRVELGEIESQLLLHDWVERCVVVAREDEENSRQLVAYVVLRDGVAQSISNESGGEIDSSYQQQLRAYLQRTLPDYMVPSAYVALDEVPLTPNGKVDKKNLPTPRGDAYGQEMYIGPQSETERLLVDIWSELLGFESDELSVRSNFFALGGHSLLVMKLIARLQRAGLQTDVRSVFDAPTVAGLAAVIDGSSSIDTYTVPPNVIPSSCVQITPDMLPLLDVNLEEIETIIAATPGGVSNIQDIYPLAPLQEGILFHHLLDPANDPYVTSSLSAFATREQLVRFVEGLQWSVNRHDALRTSVLTENLSQPVQIVWREAELSVEELALEAEQDVLDQMQALMTGPQSMPLSEAPLLRLKVAEDPNSTTWYVLMNLHHLISDHVGLEIIGTESRMYLRGEADRLPPPLPYREFVGHALHQARTLDAEGFFQERLGDVEEPTLPFGLSNVRGDGSEIEAGRLELDDELCRLIRRQAKALEVSPAVLFHAAWGLVLSACSGRDDVVFGTVLSGRLQGTHGAERMLGTFINTLPLRLKLSGKSAFELVRETALGLREVLSYEQVSLSVAQGCSGVAGDVPLFSGLLNYRHLVVGEEVKSSNKISLGRRILSTREHTNYPFAVSVNDLGKGFSLSGQIDSSVSVERVLGYLESAVRGLVEVVESGVETLVSDLNILSESERYQQLVEWNDTQTGCLKDKCVHELFEAQVAQNPHNTAVVFEDQEFTYSELNERSNQLAHYLVSQGVRPDTLVGLCIERSLEMVVGLLGILKAGGAYVPIDPTYPEERIRNMLEDSGVQLILSQSYLADQLPITEQQVIYLDSDSDSKGHEAVFANQSTQNLPKGSLDLTPEHLAYVIYTSGSGGQPKGVLIEHAALLNHISWKKQYFSPSGKDKFLQKTSLTFDISVSEIMVPLTTGGALVVARQEAEKDIPYLVELIEKEKVTTLSFVPSILREVIKFPEKLRSVENFLCGGEALQKETLNKFLTNCRGCDLYNLYGPTESTIAISIMKCGSTPANGNIPIGSPIANTQFYVVDNCSNLAPVGVAGELLIGGASLARGYLNNDELTKEKFIRNPFSSDGESKLYRTGDLVRWLPDGNLEFIGRVDDQVKVRGFRIELGEIESQLLGHDWVEHCVVVAREDGESNKQLVAYVVLTSEPHKKDDLVSDYQQQLRSFLQGMLPEYMVPSAFVELTEVPLTPNGKVDKKALPAPDSGAYGQEEYVGPRTETERVLVEIWSELLGFEVKELSVRSNFFALGGHSLLITRLVNRMHQKFGVGISLRTVFEQPSIARLSEIIDGAKRMKLSQENKASLSSSIEKLETGEI